MRLTEVPYYRLARDGDDRYDRGPTTQRPFEMALRWQPEIDIPEGMVSAASKRKGEKPQHAGSAALHVLAEGGEISQRQLAAALAYLSAAIVFYESDPWDGFEPYPGRNAEAATDLHDLFDALTEDWDEVPGEVNDEQAEATEGAPQG